MPSDHTVSVRAGRVSARRDASRIHALRYAGRVAAREKPRTAWGRIVMFFLLGFDAPAIAAAAAEGASGTGERGASTITQQLVRARLLPLDVTGPGADKYMRKAKEIIQSMRLSDEFPGELGKERIITAYLNEIFYGHGAYGIAAAAQVYFGVSDLAKLTPLQASVLAGLPKSPTTLDPYRYAQKD